MGADVITADRDLTPGDVALYRWLLERPISPVGIVRELHGTVEERTLSRVSDDLSALRRAGIASLASDNTYRLRALGISRGPT